MNSPKVSVLIPSYNSAKFLSEAIESVLVQDFGDYELLILDDASSDNTRELLEKYAAIDDRLQFQVHTQRQGMVSNWNECVRRARGDYLKFVFSDDKLCHPGALRTFVCLLDATESVSLVASARTIIDEQSREIDVWDDLGTSKFYKGPEVIVRCLKTTKNLIGEPTAVMFRKRDATRGFDPCYRQLVDLEMWFHLLEKGDLAYTNLPLSAFRRHPQQQTEFNRANVQESEQLRLFTDWSSRSWLTHRREWRQLLFRHLYLARKDQGVDTERKQFMQVFEVRLGKIWYAIYWIAHKVSAPFSNLRCSLRKRLMRYKLSQNRHGVAC